MTEQAKVPAIRFAGFTDPWEQRKLIMVAPLQRGFDLPAEKIIPGVYPVMMSNGIGAYHNEYKVKGPGVVTGRSGTIGNLQYVESAFWPHNTTLWVTKFYGNHPKFIYYLYEKIDLKRYKAGSGVPTLNRNDVHDTMVFFPASRKEQELISAVLTYLDDLITLHQRKYDKLVIFKKSMLEKMFPKDGESVPEIRFAGFTDPWEQRELVDIAEIVGGGTPDTNNSNYWDGDIDWYAPAELGNNIYAESSTRKITQAGFDSCSTKMLPADKTILFTSRAGIGNTAILRHSACTNQGFQSLVIGDADVYFVYSMSERIKKWAEEKASGSTFLEISGRQLETMPVNLPSLVEQQAIGSFFSHLDDLITLHQRKLELLQNIKKSLLDKMFV
ncbi:restriction endonuclease subunit S [Bifidobacterium longum]|uniref:restriction endonuclease subunit S n=1 Tax=Bifidobacterium longum TaxID=216816 RepID=UPI000CA697EA|nr:Type I restriction endonuclease, specificity subunit [Bifidobacterium longum]